MGFKRSLRFLMCVAISFSVWTGIIAHAVVVDKVIVVVNDEVVTQREFDRAFLPMRQNYESNFKGKELEARLEAARKGILEQLINSKLVVSLAKKAEIEIDEAEFDERVSKLKAYFDTEEGFAQTLNERGTNLSEFEREMREQMLAQRFVEREVASTIIISPAEIQDLYDKNKGQFVTPSSAKVRGIMVRKVEGDASREKIDDIAAKLKKGKDFAELATERSEGPYADKGGDMGYMSPGQTLEQIDKTVFSMQAGEISDIVETPIGYHIFLVEDVQAPRPLELKEISDFLKEQLYMRQFEEKMIKWLEEKRKNAYIAYK